MKEIKNDWGLMYNIDYRVSLKKLNSETRVNFSVKLCPSCNLVYENSFDPYKKTRSMHRYEDFPTIGLRRKKCQQCS